MREAKLRRKRRLKKQSRKAGPSGLPRWFIYVTYFVTFSFVMVMGFQIIMFGLFFEPAVGRAWLLSSLFASFMEVFVQDPLKIAATGVVKTRLELELAARKAKARRQALEGIADPVEAFEAKRKLQQELSGKAS
mmetsp:Transcript_2295/g.8381  ORF Transcript_2295/g.8381 Transcript_2295/m.8381 type:complete len:134 (-) Transcript_2295:126-527(-)